LHIFGHKGGSEMKGTSRVERVEEGDGVLSFLERKEVERGERPGERLTSILGNMQKGIEEGL